MSYAFFMALLLRLRGVVLLVVPFWLTSFDEELLSSLEQYPPKSLLLVLKSFKPMTVEYLLKSCKHIVGEFVPGEIVSSLPIL